MVFIFQKGSERPDQTLWSNSKELVQKQQEIFDKLWDLAIPLSIRRKEIELEIILLSFKEYSQVWTKSRVR